jgi:hypothetical protein
MGSIFASGAGQLRAICLIAHDGMSLRLIRLGFYCISILVAF